MKKLLLAIVILGVFASAHSQSDSIYYYYQGQKYFVQVTYGQLAIGVKKEASVKKNTLAARLQLVADSVKPSTTPNEFFVRLTGLQKSNAKTFAADLHQKDFITYVHPSIIGQGKTFVTYGDAFVVKLKQGTPVSKLTALLAKYHCTIIKHSTGDKNTYQLSAGSRNNYDAIKMANTFFETSLFEFSEPDFTTHNGLTDAPNDPLYYLQWAHHNTGSEAQHNGIAGDDMQVDSAWLITKGDSSIKIAVLDTGVDTAQADLKKNLLQGYNCITQSSNPGDGYPLDPANAHGTACAGIIAASANNNIGIAGIAPKCKIIPVAISNEFSVFASDFALSEGIDFSWQNGADVLTNSWTMGTPTGVINEAIKRAVTQGRGGKGCIVFFAAGNDNAAINYPSNIPEVISVGGSNMFNQRKNPDSYDGEYWWGANYGGGLDVVAPCVKIPTTDISGKDGYNTTEGHDGDYNLAFNGTSAATPHAAAVAALVLSVNKNFTGAEVRTIIENSCTRGGDYIYKATPGNFNGTWNQEMGYGIVNAYKSVLAAKNKKFCGAGIAEPATKILCKNASVKLSVVDSSATAVYTWRLNGANLQTGASITVTAPGTYDVVAVFANNCTSTAPAVTIMAADTTTLQADAGKAVSICPGNNGVIIGGEPSGKGGTPFIAAQRAYGYDALYGTFIRFNTNNPREYKFISLGAKDGVTNTQFVAGDFTPMGYYALNKAGELVRIDTATGYMRLLGQLVSQTGQYLSHNWSGLAWNPADKKLYGITSGGLVNGMYEINPVTARAVPLAVNPLTNNSVSWGTFSNTGGLYVFNSSYNNISRVAFNGIGSYFGTGDIGAKMLAQLDGSFDPLNGKLYLTTFAVGQTLFGDLREVDTVTAKIEVKGSIGGINEVAALAISGGTYKYSWAPATGLSNPKDANPVARPAETTTYTLTVTDACGAKATSQVVVTAGASKPPVAITASKDSICVGDSSRLSATKKDGYIYQWLYNGTIINNYADSFLQMGRGGNIQVNVTAGRGGCSNTSKTFKLKDCSIWLNNFKTDTVCYSYFYPPHGYSDTGYRPNETFTKTVYPANKGDKLRLTFNKFTGSTFAKLNIYDGPSTSSHLIKSMGFYDYLNQHASYTASEGPLTFELISDSHADNFGTWDAFFTCVTPHVYESKKSGSFTDSSTWLIKKADGTFEDAVTPPAFTDDTIIIRTGHTVTADKYYNTPVDEIWVQKGAKLNLAGGIQFADRDAFSLIADGDIALSGIAQLNTAGKVYIRGNLSTEVYSNFISSNLIADGTAPQVFSLTPNSTISVLHVLNKSGITIHGSVTMDSLFMNSSGGLQVDSLLIRRKLTFDTGIIHVKSSGVVQFSGSNLSLSSGNSKSYVDGPISVGPGAIYQFNIDYPVGTATAYRPLNLVFEKYVNDIYTIQVIDQPAPVLPLPAGIDNVSAKSYYKIKPLRNYPFANITVTMPYLQGDGITDPANLRIVRDSASKWFDIGGTGTHADTGTITSTGRFTLLGNLALANATGGTNTLPVTWLNFTARLQGYNVLLQWNIAQEINVSHYIPEYSADGEHFTALAQITAINSNTYSYLHSKFVTGINYYRIKEVDKDGRYTYSKTLSIHVSDKNNYLITPNPARDFVTIAAGDIIKQINCYNAMGQLVKKVTPAVSNYKLSLKPLAAGVYTIKIITATGTFTGKVVKE